MGKNKTIYLKMGFIPVIFLFLILISLASVNATTIATDLQGIYPLNETSGSTATNYFGALPDGAIYNVSYSVPSVNGTTGLTFGTNTSSISKVNISVPAYWLTLTTNFWYNADYNSSATQQDMNLFNNGTGGISGGYTQCGLNWTGYHMITMIKEYYSFQTHGRAYVDGVLCGTEQAVTGNKGVQVWLDPVGVNWTSFAVSSLSTDPNLLTIGSPGGNNLTISNFYVWNRTLGASEITALYNDGSSGLYPFEFLAPTVNNSFNSSYDIGTGAISFLMNTYYNNYDNITVSYFDTTNGTTVELTSGLSVPLKANNGSIFTTIAGGTSDITLTFTNNGNAFSQMVTVSASNTFGSYGTTFLLVSSGASTSSSGVFTAVVNTFTGIFPNADDLTTTQKYGSVVVVMIILTFGCLFFIGNKGGNVELSLIFAGILDFITFLYFTAIGYIDIGTIVVIGLIAVMIIMILLRFRGGN